MIKINNHLISAVKIGLSTTISMIYKGARLVWNAISSCFGSGIWYNDKPYKNDEGWKN